MKEKIKENMTCVNCIHYLACSAKGGLFNEKDYSKKMLCRFFKNKSDCEEVVRCKDCGRSKKIDNLGNYHCFIFNNTVQGKHYCSYGTKPQ